MAAAAPPKGWSWEGLHVGHGQEQRRHVGQSDEEESRGEQIQARA